MNKFVRFLYRAFYWVVPWWYGFTMTVTRKKRWPEVATYSSTTEIVKAINHGHDWREDPIRGFMDVVMSPRKFQYNIDDPNKPDGDCDDFGLYWCTALLKSGLATKAWFCSVWHARPDGSNPTGHVICVFENETGRFWCDYHKPAPCGEWDWAVAEAKVRGKVPLAAGLMEVSLRKSGEPKLHKKVRRKIF